MGIQGIPIYTLDVDSHFFPTTAHTKTKQSHQKIGKSPKPSNPNYPATTSAAKTPFKILRDSAWIKQVEAAIISYDRNKHEWGNMQTTKVSNKCIQPPHSKKTWKEWLGYQIDRFNERLIANTDWHGVYDFDMFLMDEGLRIGGDEEVKRILEVLVRNGWVMPVEEEESLYELLVRESWSF
ncbi:hypothetical protein AA313_de0209208 [Arthrobotrys entomopaga]|nr:hypothetical protein AA313_de0209208 [Arthrobotrys entomopaga]